MSLRSIVEIVTHVQNFRNIDLYFQGLYFLKISIYSQDSQEKKVYAHPFSLDESFKTHSTSSATDPSAQSARGIRQNDPQLLRAAKIIDETSSFHTKCFFIKYSEEEIDLNDFCHFRFEVDLNSATSETGDTDLFLEVELMFYDFLNPAVVASKDKDKEKEKESKTDKQKHAPQITAIDPLTEITNDSAPTSSARGGETKDKPIQRSEETQILEDSKSLSQLKFKLHNVASGINQHVSLLFSDPNCSVANLLVHSIRMDYRFRLIPIQISEFARMTTEERLALLDQEGGNQKEKKLTLTEAITRQIGTKDFKSVYEILVTTLQKSYVDLLEHYKIIDSCCILPKQRVTFKKYLSPPSEQSGTDFGFKVSMDGKSAQSLESRFGSNDAETVIHGILEEANTVSAQLCQLWHKFLDLFKISPLFCVEFYKQEIQKDIDRKVSTFIVPNQTVSEVFHIFDNPSAVQTNQQIARKLRETPEKILQQKVEQIQPSFKLQHTPIIFEDIIVKPAYKDDNDSQTRDKGELKMKSNDLIQKKNGQQQDEETDPEILQKQQEEIAEQENSQLGIHLFVMVHGLQGNAYDLKNFRNFLNFIHPEAMFLSSMMNEDNTEGDIEGLGKTLAKEVILFISENCDHQCLGKISMIGFSLGGLIIRAAVPHLQEYKDKFHTFLSLSSPHLGFMYNPSTIVDVGIWVLKRVKKSMSLKQLTMDDAPQIEQSFLYRLSKQGGLDPFKHICLVSSYQDTYSPYDSARIVMRKEAENNTTNGKLYNQMSKNIFSKIKAERVIRLDVHFSIQEKNFDTFVGRAAHIQFLESEPLTRSLIYHYPELFK